MTELQARIIQRILEDEEAMQKAADFIKMEKEQEAMQKAADFIKMEKEQEATA